MSLHRILGILIALAVMVASAVTSEALAASSPANMEMMGAGHCQMPASGKHRHDKMAGKQCCIAMCTALAVAPSVPFANAPLRQQLAGSVPPRVYRGLLAEIATPPPKQS